MMIFLDGLKKPVKHIGSIAGLLKKLNVRREEVVVKVNGRLAPETAEVGIRDKVEIIKVIFGG